MRRRRFRRGADREDRPGSSTLPHLIDSSPGRASAIAHRHLFCARRSSARRPNRRIATGRMPALSARRTSARPIAGSSRDWKKACVPHAPSISTSSQRAPYPPVPASGIAAFERAVAARLPRLRRSVGRRQCGRTHGGPLIWAPEHPRAAASARPQARTAGPTRQYPAGWSGRAARAPRPKPPREDRSSCGAARSRTVRSSSSIRPRSAVRHPRVSRRVEIRQQVDSREWSHRSRADSIVEFALQCGGDRAVVRRRLQKTPSCGNRGSQVGVEG